MTDYISNQIKNPELPFGYRFILFNNLLQFTPWSIIDLADWAKDIREEFIKEKFYMTDQRGSELIDDIYPFAKGQGDEAAGFLLEGDKITDKIVTFNLTYASDSEHKLFYMYSNIWEWLERQALSDMKDWAENSLDEEDLI